MDKQSRYDFLHILLNTNCVSLTIYDAKEILRKYDNKLTEKEINVIIKKINSRYIENNDNDNDNSTINYKKFLQYLLIDDVNKNEK